MFITIKLINFRMKRTNVKSTHYHDDNIDSEISMDCSCQILYDTSLYDIGESDCDCSQCLEANLHAFNQFKSDEDSRKTKLITRAGGRGRSTVSKGVDKKGENNTRYRSTEKFGQNKQKNRSKYNRGDRQGEESQGERQGEQKSWAGPGLDQFLIVTRNRIHRYIEERKKLKNHEQQEKDRLKEKIKRNLQILKYTQQQDRNEVDVNGEGKGKSYQHKYKWNHSKYECKCGKEENEEKHECCRKIKQKIRLDTGLDKLKENFSENRELILEQNKEKRIAEMKQEFGCHCPNHHNRTDGKKIKKIQKFIEKQAKKYEKSLKQKKQKEEQAKKVKEAKLRAIDLKSKEILERSKKIDDSDKTSFHLTIDNYDTFSELREENQRRKKAKNNEREVKRSLKQGGGKLEQAIYENMEEEQEEFAFPKPGQNIVLRKTTQGEMQKFSGKAEYSQKILHDAKISSPGTLKKKQKQQSRVTRYDQEQKQKKSALNKQKEEKHKKKLQDEIERKKKQIMAEYSKRNTTREPANKQLREEYEKKGKKQKGKTTIPKQTNSKDVHRTNYKHQPGKDVNQINAHGDPLLQEYVYHEGKRMKSMANSDENNQIFTQNLNSLKGKGQLRL